MKQRLVVLCTCLILYACNSSNDDSAASIPKPALVAAPSLNSASALPASTVDEVGNISPAQEASNVLPPSEQIQQSYLEPSEESVLFVVVQDAEITINSTKVILPFGMPVLKAPEWVCSSPRASFNDAVCIYVDNAFGNPFPQLGIDYEDGEIPDAVPGGWVSAKMLSKEEPKLRDILAEFNAAPKENLARRRILAKQAYALDPWSKESYDRIASVLKEAGDTEGLKSAASIFKRFHSHQPEIAPGELPTVFQYGPYGLVPHIINDNGRLKLAADFFFNSPRGSFFYVYGAKNVGYLVSKIGLSGNVQYVPVDEVDPAGKPITHPTDTEPMNTVPPDKQPHLVYATNFPWPERHKKLPAISQKQKSLLYAGLQEKLAKDYAGDAGAVARKHIKSGEVRVYSGQLSNDGRMFLIADVQVGSAGDVFYNESQYVYELVILEQQQDGSFVQAQVDIAGLNKGYCSIDGTLRDIDGDGADEVTITCNMLVEGPGGDINGFLQRVNGRWLVAF